MEIVKPTLSPEIVTICGGTVTVKCEDANDWAMLPDKITVYDEECKKDSWNSVFKTCTYLLVTEPSFA